MPTPDNSHINNYTKFRPYLTIPEMDVILGALKSTPDNIPVSLIRYLEGYIYKAKSGISSANYTARPRETLQSKLGFSDSTTTILTRNLSDLKLAAYQKWQNNPASCNPAELARVQMYRYENDLMDIEEEKRYEKSQGL